MRLTALAPAKVNLFLHVGPVQPGGYHPLASLVAFADVGDLITVEPAERLSLTVTGPFASGLSGEGDNLILRALRALGEVTGAGEPPLKITLDKRLPIAAGLGGGSSDAAVALKLARQALALDIDDGGLEAIVGVVGADGVMCLRARTALAEGRGDVLSEWPDLPPLHAVLFNPGVPSPTGAVYRAYDEAPQALGQTPRMPRDVSTGSVIGWLAEHRNDLEAPAVGLEPAIAEALAAMGATDEVRLVRMSGSGATVFGLFEDAASAENAARHLSSEYGQAWCGVCVLGDKKSQTIQ